ncbi:MAG: hypothetical protein AUI14_08125 [Actinobacteria bacterium 13_2_20CM_2_71_6]|nr:MAG: hypothetical protein AUI14_08125 [Actinobacteria bacterium 13_2_20CM_2_71_6]
MDVTGGGQGHTDTGEPRQTRARRGRPRDPGVDTAIRAATLDLLGEIGYARFVPEVPDTGTLPADMRVFLTALLRAREAASRALSAVTGEIASNPELRAAWRHGVAGALTGCLRTIVSHAVERGELPPDSDVELLAQLPLSLLQNWRQSHDERPDEAVVERIVAQFYTPR